MHRLTSRASALVLAAACLAVVSGCRLPFSESPALTVTAPLDSLIVPPQYDLDRLPEHAQIAIPEDAQFVFCVFERVEYGTGRKPFIHLLVRSEKKQGSSSIHYLADAHSGGGVISVDFVGVIVPDMQTGDIWYTTWEADLRLPPGQYALQLSHGGKPDRYRLAVDDEYIRVRADGPIHFVRPSFTDFFRYPERSFACYGTGATTDSCTAFVERIAREFNLVGFHLPPEQDGLVTCYERGPNRIAMNARALMVPKFFRYEKEEDFEAIRTAAHALTDRMRRQDPTFSLYVENWLGMI